MSEIRIRSLNKLNYKGCLYLYKPYADVYRTSLTEIGIETTWNWLMGSPQPRTDIVAEQDNILFTLALFRRMPSPLRGENVRFLEDLYILPKYRGGKIVRLLFKALREYGHNNNWQIIRWFTRDNNYRAKNIYDKLASTTDWNTYEMKV